jgi:hypothetical protein
VITLDSETQETWKIINGPRDRWDLDTRLDAPREGAETPATK